MTDITHGAEAPAADRAANAYYFIAWRWHFYAGLYVIPFLLMLAVTGLTMLWISWGAGIGAERMAVVPGARTLPVGRLLEAAEAAVPVGRAVQYVEPLAGNRVASVAVETTEGTTGVALDPFSGEVLQSFAWRGGWYDTMNAIHGTAMLGAFGDRMIEIAASLAILLVATGLYLHWPRNGAGWRATLWPAMMLIGLVRGRKLTWAGQWPGFDRAAYAAKLAAPLLVIHGEQDRVCPLEDGRSIAEAAPDGRLVVLPGAPHNGLWANPETKAALEREIGAFLDGVLSEPSAT